MSGFASGPLPDGKGVQSTGFLSVQLLYWVLFSADSEGRSDSQYQFSRPMGLILCSS